MCNGKHKSESRILCFTVCAFLISFFSVGPAQAIDYLKQQRISTLLERKMQMDGIPASAVAIIEDGTLSWTSALGWANVEHAVKAIDNSIFRTGSLIKPLTATAALQLVDSGKLELDDPINHYCSEYPEKPWPITTRQLLSHTAGVRSYNMPWQQFEAELLSTVSYESISEALSIFKDDPLKTEPGSAHLYSSYGYNLLGCVIEGASGVEFVKYLEKNVLIPAGMINTSVDEARLVVPNRVAGYRRNKKGHLVNEHYVDLSNKIPSGGYLTTVGDMARFAISLMNGKLLPSDLIKLAMSPVSLTEGSSTSYGLGWQIDANRRDSDSLAVYHGGVTPGVSAILYLLPEQKNAVVLMMNYYIVDGREELAREILSIVDSD